jgi:hypothetical protein
MITPTSRYANLDTGTVAVNVDGEPRQVRYLRRRFIPPPAGMITLVQHTIQQGDRVDNLSAFYFTDPLQFWRICDANNVLHPDEVLSPIGRSVAIILPLR